MAPHDQGRLIALAQTRHVPSQPPLIKLRELTQNDVPNFVTATSEQRAEHCLLESKNSTPIRKPSLIRTKGRVEAFEAKVITATLPRLVDANESAGVIQILLNKESQFSSTKEGNKKQGQTGDRDALLLTAVNSSNVELVWLLAPQTSLSGRNQALANALYKRTSSIIQKLLEYDADPTYCSEQFVAAAAAGDHFVVEHLLSAPQALRQSTILAAVTPAVQSRSLRTLQRIVDAADLNGLQEIEAVKLAVGHGEVDALLTLLPAANSIRPDFLDDLVLEAFNNPDIDADSLATILHALFYAGASGPKSSAAMRHAVEKRAIKLVQIFATHQVDINWGKGGVVKSAVETGQLDLLQEALRSGALSKDNAAIAVQSLPHTLQSQTRYEMLKALLEAGAYGPPVEKELVRAVRNDDRDLAALLRSGGVSIDTDQGEALIAAIQRENIEVLNNLLSGPVAQFSLQRALPYVRHASMIPRLRMTKLLLGAKVEGQVVHAALRDAVCDDSSDRDEELIDVLIQAGGSPMFEENQSLRYAILHEDSGLFERLLTGPTGVSEGAISSLVPEIMTVKDQGTRYYMMKSALDVRPKQDSVSQALSSLISEDEVDMPLLQLLVRSGQVNVDYSGGVIMMNGIKAARRVLEELLRLPDRSRSTTSVALVKLLQLKSFDDKNKADRTGLLLATRRTPTVATEGVLHYIAFLKDSGLSGEDWPLQTFDVLIRAGAEIEVLTKAGALLGVTQAAANGLLSMLLSLKPALSHVDDALLEAVTVHGAKGITTIEILLDAGPTKDSISLALVEASRLNAEVVCAMLMKYGGSISFQDCAAVRYASASGNLSLLRVFLGSKPSQEAIEAAFKSAKAVVDVDQRYQVTQAILKIGVRRDLLSKYLVSQVNLGTQPKMIELLLQYQADVHYHQNHSLVQAALQANLEIVQILFAHVTNKPAVATQCFEACVQNNLIKQERLSVLSFLLEVGASGNSLNGALRQAIYNLSTQPGLLDLLTMLVTHGADVNQDDGHALCRACETLGPDAVMPLMKAKPSGMIRARAIHSLLKSSITDRSFCQILDMLMTTESSSEESPDLSIRQDKSENPVRMLLTQRPNGAMELAHLLKYQPKLLLQPENSDLLAWAMVQEKTRIHDDCIALLINQGANINYRNPQSGCSVLFQAVRSRRSGLVRPLLVRGADSSIADNQGTSPLLLASILGDQTTVSNLLETGAPVNDGSLHHAACGLKTHVVESLLVNGHDPNFPSPQHQGRTALAELLYLGEANPQNQGTIEKVINLLRKHGADTRKLVARKPLVCWALDNKHDPMGMVQALLRAYLYRDLDEDFNFYNDGKFIYSPTMYVAKRQFAGPEASADELVTLLRTSGANKDVYYCLTGAQPEDAIGMPEDVAKLELVRRTKSAMRREEEEDLQRRRRVEAEERDRLRRIDEEEHRRRKEREEEEFQRRLSYRRRLELEDQKLLREKNALAITLNGETEAAKRREMHTAHNLELTLSGQRAEAEKRLIRDRNEMQRAERADELRHRTAVGELEIGTTKQRLMLESDHQKMAAAAAQTALEARNKEQNKLMSSQDHYSEKMHKRRMKQLALEKALPVGTMSPSGGGFIEG